MVATALVGADTELGEAAYNALKDDQRLGMTAALWLYDKDAEDWRFAVACQQYDREGPRAAYERIGDLLDQANVRERLPLSRIMAVSPYHPTIVALNRIFSVRTTTLPANLTLSNVTINDETVNAFIYEMRSPPPATFVARKSVLTHQRFVGKKPKRQNVMRLKMGQWGETFSMNAAVKAIQSPNQCHNLKIDELEIAFVLRQTGNGADLVGVKLAPHKDRGNIEFAIHVRDGFGRRLEEMTPIEILHEVVSKFGVEFIIIGQTRKFVLQEVLQVPDGFKGDIFGIRPSKLGTHSLQASTIIKPFYLGGKLAAVEAIMAFVLDVTALSEWNADDKQSQATTDSPAAL